MHKVLVIDDEPLIRTGLKQIIPWEKYGFTICGLAKNGKEAIVQYDLLQPDLIITDINMPDMNGLELIQYLRLERNSSIQMVVLSGYKEFEYAKQAMKYNVNCYLLKPVDEDELIEVISKIKTDIEAEKSQQEKLRNYQSAAIKEIFIQLLQGTASEDEISEILKHYPVLAKGNYCYCVIRMLEKTDIPPSVTADKGRQNASQIIKRILLPESFPLIIDEPDEKCGLLLYSDVFMKHGSLQSYVEAFRRKMEEQFPSSFFITIGREVGTLAEIQESYRTAVIAQDYYLYKGANTVLYYEAIAPFVHQSAYDHVESFDSLLTAAENNQDEKIPMLIESLIADLKTVTPSPSWVKLTLIDAIMKTQKILDSYGGKKEIAADYCYILEHQFYQLTFKEIGELLHKFYQDYRTAISNLRSKNKQGIIAEITSYIDQNLQNNITLKSIAGKFYMNPAYLGQLFRKKLGISFNEYIHKHRIDAAKHMLLNSNSKIYEVAKAVGYHDPNYFISRFMKEVDMTPTEFRAAHLSNSE